MRLHEWRRWGESVRDVPSGTEEDVSGNRAAHATSPPRVSASGPRSIPVACGETHPVTGGSDAAFSFMVSEFRAWVAVAASRSGLRRSPRTERSCGAFRCGWRSERRRARRWRASLFGPTSNRNVRFSALFFEKLDFKICFDILSRVDAIRRVVTQKMSNAPLGGKQSRGTDGGQFSNRGPRLAKFKRSNRRVDEARRARRGKHPRVRSSDERDELRLASRLGGGGIPSWGQCRVARGDPTRRVTGCRRRRKKRRRRRHPRPRRPRPPPASPPRQRTTAPCSTSSWPSAFRRVGSFPRSSTPPTTPDPHRRPHPSPRPSDRRNQRKKRSLTQTKTKLAELCVPAPVAPPSSSPSRDIPPAPSRVGVPI